MMTSGSRARRVRRAAGRGGKGGKPGKGDTARNRAVSARPGRPWGLTVGFAAVGVFAAVVIGLAVWPRSSAPASGGDVAAITGVVNFRATDAGSLTRNHKPGGLSYQVSPPVGGDHNPVWQNCGGTVYTAQIPNEHAVHSLEHGAVWLTYRPDLPAGQVAKLAERVRGHDYTLMSPYPGLGSAISVQAWGYQLAVDSHDDARIDQFITATRVKAAPEPGATCSGGNTTTGTAPVTGAGMPQTS